MSMGRFSGWKNVKSGESGFEKPKKRMQTEGVLQQQCVSWFYSQYPDLMIMSSLNAGKLAGNPIERVKAWKRYLAEGAVTGAADLQVVFPNGQHHGLFIEMKTEDGKQSIDQKDFQKRVVKLGYRYELCRSLGGFKALLFDYFQGSNENSDNL
jgi:hypothetical protein